MFSLSSMIGFDFFHLLTVNGLAELWDDGVWSGQEITMQFYSPTSFSLSVHQKHNNLPKIGSEVQKMAKNVKLQLKASYFRKVREKIFFILVF